jgi:hypothetical protein
MIKMLLKYGFISVALSFFLIGSLGLNVINYCCDTCEQQGIKLIAEQSCEAFHHSITDHNHESCCSQEKAETDFGCSDASHHTQNGCHLLRLKIDVPVFKNLHNELTLYEIVTCHLLFSTIVFFAEVTGISEDTSDPPNFHLSTSGREILSQSSVLRI